MDADGIVHAFGEKWNWQNSACSVVSAMAGGTADFPEGEGGFAEFSRAPGLEIDK